MKVRNELIIKKNVNDVWEVMGKGFADIHIWASYFTNSKASGGAKFDGIDFSARETFVKDGQNTHALDVFDNDNYVLSYLVTSGTPPFADKAEAQWALEVIDENACMASIEVNMILKDMVLAEKAAEINNWLSTSADGMLNEMKYFIETGNIHPNKLKSISE